MAEQCDARAASLVAPDCTDGLNAARRTGAAARRSDAPAPGAAKKSPRPLRARIYVNLFNVWPRYVAARGRGR
jgi:hypothetical protein